MNFCNVIGCIFVVVGIVCLNEVRIGILIVLRVGYFEIVLVLWFVIFLFVCIFSMFFFMWSYWVFVVIVVKEVNVLVGGIWSVELDNVIEVMLFVCCYSLNFKVEWWYLVYIGFGFLFICVVLIYLIVFLELL